MDETVITELKIPNIPNIPSEEPPLRRETNQKEESIPEYAHRIFQKKGGEKPYRYWLQSTIDFLKDNITILIMKDFLYPTVVEGSAAGIAPNRLEGVWENEEKFNVFIQQLIKANAPKSIIDINRATFFRRNELRSDPLSPTSVLTNQEDQGVASYEPNKDMMRNYFLAIAEKEPEFNELDWVRIVYSSPSSSSEIPCDYSGTLCSSQ
jgi:hypothetical protein